MTPYEFAQALAADSRLAALPHPVLPQLGDVVVDCEGTWVSVTSVNSETVAGSAACGIIEMADVTLVSAFECSITADDDGLTDPTKLAEVSAKMDVIGTALRDFAEEIVAAGFVEGNVNGTQYVNTGGLGIVTVTLTTPVP